MSDILNDGSLYIFSLLDMPFSIGSRPTILKRIYVEAESYNEAIFVAQTAFKQKTWNCIRFSGRSPQSDTVIHKHRGYYDSSPIHFSPDLDVDIHMVYPFVYVLTRDEKLQVLLSE